MCSEKPRKLGQSLLTLFVQGNLVTFHPGRSLLPQLCPHSAGILSMFTDGKVEAGEVTFKSGDVYTAQFGLCDWGAVDKTQITDLIIMS